MPDKDNDELFIGMMDLVRNEDAESLGGLAAALYFHLRQSHSDKEIQEMVLVGGNLLTEWTANEMLKSIGKGNG